jgi:arginine-tRNA-protein transferase
MRSETVRLLKTLPHPCGYYAGRVAQNLVIDPLAADLPEVYEVALTRGYRRAGGHIYRPSCARCSACVPARVPVDGFAPNRSQRRCLKRNADLVYSDAPARFGEQVFDLYRRYLGARHPGGGMDDAEREDFGRFLTSPWSPTRFFEYRLDGRLVAVAVTDVTRFGLSSVYTFYEPAEAARGLGTYCILHQVAECRRRGLPHLYLGYWIDGHPKMGYKRCFQPLELLRGQRWERALPDPEHTP